MCHPHRAALAWHSLMTHCDVNIKAIACSSTQLNEALQHMNTLPFQRACQVLTACRRSACQLCAPIASARSAPCMEWLSTVLTGMSFTTLSSRSVIVVPVRPLPAVRRTSGLVGLTWRVCHFRSPGAFPGGIVPVSPTACKQVRSPLFAAHTAGWAEENVDRAEKAASWKDAHLFLLPTASKPASGSPWWPVRSPAP